jgi:hypothetical protein
MSILVTVTFDAAPEVVAQVEEDHPDLMQTLGASAAKYFVSHRRLVRDDRVMDLDEFASKADHDAFLAEAGDVVRKYEQLVGGQATDTVWTVLDHGPPE